MNKTNLQGQKHTIIQKILALTPKNAKWTIPYLLSGPLADPHEIKVFYKGYFRQNIGCFIEILTKIKSKLTSKFLEFLSDPYL